MYLLLHLILHLLAWRIWQVEALWSCTSRHPDGHHKAQGAAKELGWQCRELLPLAWFCSGLSGETHIFWCFVLEHLLPCSTDTRQSGVCLSGRPLVRAGLIQGYECIIWHLCHVFNVCILGRLLCNIQYFTMFSSKLPLYWQFEISELEMKIKLKANSPWPTFVRGYWNALPGGCFLSYVAQRVLG